MTRTGFALGTGALLLLSVVGAKSDFGHLSEARSKSPSSVDTPMVVAQAAPANAAPEAPQQGVAFQQTPPQPANPQGSGYVGSPQSAYMQDQQAVARINAQIDALMVPPAGGFAVQYYAKPAPPPMPPLQQAAYPGQGGGLPPGPPPGTVRRDRKGIADKYVIARPGDTVYATLDRAFNSDDPQAPIFATIRDVDNVGVQGPLDGVRMVGNIVYSNSQGAIQFNNGYLPDGRPVEVKGIAVSEDTARTGIAKDVDTHAIQRYGALLFATLAQGAGQVGQILLQNNQQGYVDPATGLLISSQKVSPYQAAAAGLLPAGQALTAAAAQGFNQPPTISGPAGMGLGIVFLEPVVVPGDVLYARRR